MKTPTLKKTTKKSEKSSNKKVREPKSKLSALRRLTLRTRIIIASSAAVLLLGGGFGCFALINSLSSGHENTPETVAESTSEESSDKNPDTSKDDTKDQSKDTKDKEKKTDSKDDDKDNKKDSEQPATKPQAQANNTRPATTPNQTQAAPASQPAPAAQPYVAPTANYYPYYSMLTARERTLYDQLYNAINKVASSVTPSITSVTEAEVAHATLAVYSDRPELFWLDSSFGYRHTSSGQILDITIYYNDTSRNLATAKANFNAKAGAIINGARSLTTNYEKEKYVHDALTRSVVYDTSATYDQSAYSALVLGRSVCAGYARAFQYIMMQLGVPTYYVSGLQSGSHAWNLVLLDDGFYNVDVTLDDSTGSYRYFNLPDSAISGSHIRTELSVNLPRCTATRFYSGR